MDIEIAAKIAYYANKTYCEFLGDFSLVDWEDAPINIKQSLINGVRFKLDNPLISPADSHNNWIRFKTEDGWVYGEEKNMEKKTHPCLIPYEELPLKQQIKDHLFTGIINSLAPFIN